jgi:pimeloyl-ACP methyl ester carboxylesterase
MTPERIIHANGVDLCVQTFGAATDPALLLIAGAASSMDWWEDGFCRRLADGSRFVIRYDLRDTGRSTSYPPGQPGYSFDDRSATRWPCCRPWRLGVPMSWASRWAVRSHSIWRWTTPNASPR